MKINTKETTPLSPSILVRPNRFILEEDVLNTTTNNDKTSDTDTRNDDEGRKVKYEPTMIFTPVMSSSRTQRGSPDRPRLERNEVDEVCTMLNRLFLKETESKTITNKQGSKQEMKPEIAPKVKAEKAGEERTIEGEAQLGRFKVSVMSPKTMSPITVHRSGRLAMM
jgi:hypothetical protein